MADYDLIVRNARIVTAERQSEGDIAVKDGKVAALGADVKGTATREIDAAGKFVLPGGVDSPVRAFKAVGCEPVFIRRASGSRLEDVDGNEYIDYYGGHGALLLGHQHPAVIEAIAKQLRKGLHLAAANELEVEWAELIRRMIPSAERVRFTSSGTEATLMAVRLARAFTGKTKLVRFLTNFHGWHDHMTAGHASHFDGSATAGVIAEIAALMATDIKQLARPFITAAMSGLRERRRHRRLRRVSFIGRPRRQIDVQRQQRSVGREEAADHADDERVQAPVGLQREQVRQQRRNVGDEHECAREPKTLPRSGNRFAHGTAPTVLGAREDDVSAYAAGGGAHTGQVFVEALLVPTFEIVRRYLHRLT